MARTQRSTCCQSLLANKPPFLINLSTTRNKKATLVIIVSEINRSSMTLACVVLEGSIGVLGIGTEERTGEGTGDGTVQVGTVVGPDACSVGSTTILDKSSFMISEKTLAFVGGSSCFFGLSLGRLGFFEGLPGLSVLELFTILAERKLGYLLLGFYLWSSALLGFYFWSSALLGFYLWSFASAWLLLLVVCSAWLRFCAHNTNTRRPALHVPIVPVYS